MIGLGKKGCGKNYSQSKKDVLRKSMCLKKEREEEEEDYVCR